MELEECIKDGFDDSLREFIQSEEYRTQKKQERYLLEELQRGFSETQKRQFNMFLNAATESNSMLLSEAYLHGVVEGIALHNKVIR